MKKFQLGEFEGIVLLMVGVLYGDAYGVAIKEAIEKRLKRRVSVGTLQSALRRMEKRGFLRSEFGDTTQTRGGKRKRYFKITAFGKRALDFNIQPETYLRISVPAENQYCESMRLLGKGIPLGESITQVAFQFTTC